MSRIPSPHTNPISISDILVILAVVTVLYFAADISPILLAIPVMIVVGARLAIMLLAAIDVDPQIVTVSLFALGVIFGFALLWSDRGQSPFVIVAIIISAWLMMTTLRGVLSRQRSNGPLRPIPDSVDDRLQAAVLEAVIAELRVDERSKNSNTGSISLNRAFEQHFRILKGQNLWIRPIRNVDSIPNSSLFMGVFGCLFGKLSVQFSNR
jgi:hypothetical protein